MKKILKNKQYLLEIFIILIFGALPFLWFKDGHLAAGHDMSYPLAPIDFWLDRLYVWTDRIGSFGSNQTDAIPGVFIHGLQALLYYLTRNLQLSQKIDFTIWFVLPGITMYALLYSLHPKKDKFIIRISGSLFYMINYYLLQAWTIAEMSKFSMVIAIPLVVLAIINVSLRNKSPLRNSLIVGFTLFFLNGGAGIPLWGGLMVTALTTLIISIIVSPKLSKKKFINISKFVLFSLTFVVLLNLYWVYPYASSFRFNYVQRLEMAGGSEGAMAWSQEVSRNASYTNLIKLQGIPDWYNNPEHPYSNKLLGNYLYIFLALIFPALALLSFIKNRQDNVYDLRYKAIFTGILLIALPLTAGSHPPSGILYDIALKYIPGFSIFRTPFYKFGMALWFSYSYLIAIGLKNTADYFKEKFALKINAITINVITLVVFISLLAIYNYPVFTGIFFNWSKDNSTLIQVPDYINDVKAELDGNMFSTRTLLLPQLNDGNKYITYDWKYFSLSTITSMLSNKPVLINDGTLIGYESSLVNAIYEELTQLSKSKLIRFAGVDRAVVQEDFIAKNSMDYQTTITKEALYNSPDFSFSKEIGKWKFYKMTKDEVAPLFYIPQQLTYIISESSRLSQAVNIPGVSELGDALTFEHVSKSTKLDPIVNPEMIENLIIQGQCANCEDKKDSGVFDSPVPIIMPSNPLYLFLELIDNRKLAKLTTPEARIDFILGNMAKEVSAFDIIIQNPKNSESSEKIINNWLMDLESINIEFEKIESLDKKTEYSRRAGLYYWNFLVRVQKWIELWLTPEAGLELTNFEDELSTFIRGTDFKSETVENDEIGVKKYKISVPEDGNYKIIVHNPKSTDTDFIDASVNNNPYRIQKINLDEKWYSGDIVRLSKGDQYLDIPELVSTEKEHPGLEIEWKPGSTECKSVDLGKIDPENKYEIQLEYSTIINRLVQIKLYENNNQITDGEAKPIRFEIVKNTLTPYLHSAVAEYTPGKLTQSAYLEFCLQGEFLRQTEFNLNQIKVIEKYPEYVVFLLGQKPLNISDNYKLEFVALNQAAYLVRVNNVANKYFLNFNSRFDKNWKLRKTDSVKYDKYFTGQTREYLDGVVVEYERQDKHNYFGLFDTLDTQMSPDISFNTFSNGWLLDNPEGEETTYIIEYSLQKTTYMLVAVSLLSFIGLCILTLVVVTKRRSYDSKN